jgi:hypothetical protein
LLNNIFILDHSELNAKSDVIQLLRAIIDRDIYPIFDFYKRICSSEFLVIEHPLKSNIITYATDSIRDGMVNFIFFNASDGQSPWILVQLTNVIDAFIVGEDVYSCLNFIHPAVFQSYENQKLDKLEVYPALKKKFCGFLIGQGRPFHFFYDQLKFLPLLSKIKGSKEFATIDGALFFDPSLFVGPVNKELLTDNGIYLMPNVIGQNWLDAADANVRRLMGNMERALLKHSLVQFPVNRVGSDFILWIGITGQKRSWVEQVEGYVQIINQLSVYFENLVVYVDGYTAEFDRPPPVLAIKEDLEIFHKICDKVGKSVSMVSLIGETYTQKISYCNTVDAFLANGGNGSFVPLRVCKKAGLIHSNSKLLTFRDLYGDHVKFVDKSEIVDVKLSDDPDPSNLSYSIKPDVVADNFYELIWRIYSLELRGPLECKQLS